MLSSSAQEPKLPSLLDSLPASVKEQTPMFGAKMVVNLLMTAVGLYYLAIGKKEADVKKMAIGCALMLGAMFLF